MLKRHTLLLLVVGGLLLLGSALATAQTSMIFYFKVVDDAGGKDSLVFGSNDAATYDVDAALGENSSPPLPPGFSAIFVAPHNSPTWGIGLLKKDLRDTPADPARKDTFVVQIQNDDASAVSANCTLSWPDPTWIAARCDSMALIITGGCPDLPPNGRLNMSSQSTLTITTPYDGSGWNGGAPRFKVKIIQYGHRTPNLDGVRRESSLTPARFNLDQNYPNPFNPTTTMKFDIQKSGLTEIAVYNMLGQKVSTLVSSDLTPGTYTVQWNGTNDRGASVTSGVYFVRMSVRAEGATTFSAVRKMMFMK